MIDEPVGSGEKKRNTCYANGTEPDRGKYYIPDSCKKGTAA